MSTTQDGKDSFHVCLRRRADSRSWGKRS